MLDLNTPVLKVKEFPSGPKATSFITWKIGKRDLMIFIARMSHHSKFQTVYRRKRGKLSSSVQFENENDVTPSTIKIGLAPSLLSEMVTATSHSTIFDIPMRPVRENHRHRRRFTR